MKKSNKTERCDEENILSQDNRDFFISWVINKYYYKGTNNVCIDTLLLIINDNIELWINNENSWTDCFTVLNVLIQNNIQMEKEREREKTHPTNIQSKRELLASKLEKKINNNIFQKIKKRKKYS